MKVLILTKQACDLTDVLTNCGVETRIMTVAEAENGSHSAHYTAFYHAALLFGYKYSGKAVYLETAKKGLETLMSV